MQLTNPVAALIKAMGTFSPIHPADFPLSPTNSFLPARPHSLPTCHTFPREGDFTYLGMEAVSLVMLLLYSAWCRVPVSQKKFPSLKCMTMCQIRTHAYQESYVLVQALPWHCPLSWASRFQKLLRLTGMTGRVTRGWGPGLLASRE